MFFKKLMVVLCGFEPCNGYWLEVPENPYAKNHAEYSVNVFPVDSHFHNSCNLPNEVYSNFEINSFGSDVVLLK